MPLRGVDGGVYAYIVLAVGASDIQLFIFSGDFNLNDLALHFRRLVDGAASVLPGAGERCGYWCGSDSRVSFVLLFILFILCRYKQDFFSAMLIITKKKHFKRIVGLRGVPFGFACAQSLALGTNILVCEQFLGYHFVGCWGYSCCVCGY